MRSQGWNEDSFEDFADGRLDAHETAAPDRQGEL